jgi:hypothetical protein
MIQFDAGYGVQFFPDAGVQTATQGRRDKRALDVDSLLGLAL